MPLALDHAHWKLEVGEVVIEVSDFELGLIQQVDIPYHVKSMILKILQQTTSTTTGHHLDKKCQL